MKRLLPTDECGLVRTDARPTFFTVLELPNPPFDVSELHGNGRSPDLPDKPFYNFRSFKICRPTFLNDIKFINRLIFKVYKIALFHVI